MKIDENDGDIDILKANKRKKLTEFEDINYNRYRNITK
jgi:hypothetical protein